MRDVNFAISPLCIIDFSLVMSSEMFDNLAFFIKGLTITLQSLVFATLLSDKINSSRFSKSFFQDENAVGLADNQRHAQCSLRWRTSRLGNVAWGRVLQALQKRSTTSLLFQMAFGTLSCPWPVSLLTS
jgi:hypothetical protein